MILRANGSNELKVVDLIPPGHNEFMLESLPINGFSDMYIVSCDNNTQSSHSSKVVPLKLQVIDVSVTTPTPEVATIWSSTEVTPSSTKPIEAPQISSSIYICMYYYR